MDSIINWIFTQQLDILFCLIGKENVLVVKDYLFCVQDQKDRIYSTVRSKSTSATVNNLKPSTAYVFQIRAFTEAGYGTYGPRLEITTKEETTGRRLQEQTLCAAAVLHNRISVWQGCKHRLYVCIIHIQNILSHTVRRYARLGTGTFSMVSLSVL